MSHSKINNIIDTFQLLQDNSERVREEIRLKAILNAQISTKKLFTKLTTIKDKTQAQTDLFNDLKSIAIVLNDYGKLDSENLKLKSENEKLKLLARLSEIEFMKESCFKELVELRKENEQLKKNIQL